MTVITFISCRLTTAHIILVNCSVLLLDFCDAAALILSTVFYLLKQVALSIVGMSCRMITGGHAGWRRLTCNNRPHRWTDHVATRVALHDLALRSPSAPNRTDRRTNTGLAHSIYHASIASRDKNLVYLFLGHLRVSLKVLPSNFLYVVWNSVSCDGPLPNTKRHLSRSSGSYFNTPEWQTPGMADQNRSVMLYE